MNQKLPASKSATKQTTMGNFFQMPVRSLNNVLLAGARRMAKSTELLTAKKSSGGNNASNGGKRKRVDYSKVRYCCIYVLPIQERMLNRDSSIVLSVALVSSVQKDSKHRFRLRRLHVCKGFTDKELLPNSLPL
jgi:hypothetical protein